MENWKDIAGYEGSYQVSDLGNIKSLNYKRSGQARNLKPSVDGCGYLRVALCKNGRLRTRKVHRLVAEAFLGDSSGKEVNHKDGNRTNNNIANLELVTRLENMRHSFNELGRRGGLLGKKAEKHPKSKEVQQYTRDGKYIRDWVNIRDAAATLGINNGNITECCKGKRKTAGGFIWKHKNS